MDFSEVLDGVAEGDRVVLSDQDKLRPGRPVRVRISKVTPRVNVQ
jgi:antitoxin (DNA-binding transcriptional repressor) of toxin-antitoxin stability system